MTHWWQFRKRRVERERRTDEVMAAWFLEVFGPDPRGFDPAAYRPPWER